MLEERNHLENIRKGFGRKSGTSEYVPNLFDLTETHPSANLPPPKSGIGGLCMKGGIYTKKCAAKEGKTT